MWNKISLLLFIAIIATSCKSQNEKEKIDLDSLDEEFLYNFGLDAPEDVYIILKKELNEQEKETICSETTIFPVVSVLFDVKDSIVTKIVVKSLHEYPKTNKIIIDKFQGKVLHFSFIDNYKHSTYDFRLHIERFCLAK